MNNLILVQSKFKTSVFLLITALLGFLTLQVKGQNMDNLRVAYHAATDDEVKAKTFYEMVQHVTLDSDPVLMAYKGGGLALLAQYAKLTDRKKKIQEAIIWIESGVKKAPYDPEIRLIRLSVQENLPKFLKYHENIEEDRKIVEQALKDSHNQSLKKMIKGYFEKFSKKS